MVCYIYFGQTEDGIKETTTKMIASIRRQEIDILRNLHQKRDQELEPLLKKIDNVEAFLANAQWLKVSQMLLLRMWHWLEIICNFGQWSDAILRVSFTIVRRYQKIKYLSMIIH